MIQTPEDQEQDPPGNNTQRNPGTSLVLLLARIAGLVLIGVVFKSLNSSRRHTERPQTHVDLSKALPPPFEGPGMYCTSPRCIQNARSVVDWMNSSVDPCDDFFEFACGGWIARNPLPSNVSNWSQFRKLSEESNKVTQDILSHPVQPEDPLALTQAKEFYSACVDVNELDRVGLKPILSLLDDYGGWPMIKQQDSWSPESFDWTKSVADLKRLFRTSAFFDIRIIQTRNSPQNNTIHLSKPALFVSRHFLLHLSHSPGLVFAYHDFIMGMANELAKSTGVTLNQTELSDSATELISFEIKLAGLTKDSDADGFTVTRLENIFHNDTLHNSTNKVLLKKLLETTFQSNQVVLSNSQLISTEDVSFIQNTLNLITSTTPKTLSNYIHFRMLASIASESTQRMREIKAKYQSQVFIGEEPSREFTCASSAEEKFGLALSRPYLERREITHKEISQVVQMVADVRQSLVSLLVGVKWMDPMTKLILNYVASISIKPCVGFPSWMPPYKSTKYNEKLNEHFNGLNLGEGSSYFEKLTRFHTWESDQMINELKKPFKTGCDWTSHRGIVNAFYDPKRQTIDFPLGVLQAPFFYADDSFSAVNFGAIGSLIGHEFTHGLTGNGWSVTGNGSFTRVSQCLIRQYGGYKLNQVPEEEVNGALTLEEHFADNGGLMAAYRAYQRWSPKTRRPIPGLEGFTQDQLFFLGYANNWCSSSTPESLRGQLVLGSRSPAPLRVLGPLHNMKEFTEAWKCPVGSNLNPIGITRCNVF